MAHAAMRGGRGQPGHVQQCASADRDHVAVAVDVVHLDFEMNFRDVKIGVLRPLAALELHGVADKIQAFAVPVEVHPDLFGQAGLCSAQRLVPRHECPASSSVFVIGESLTERRVIRGKHISSEPHLMSVGHVDLSLTQAHCVRERYNAGR